MADKLFDHQNDCAFAQRRRQVAGVSTTMLFTRARLEFLKQFF